MNAEAWEQIRFKTFDEVVTFIKAINGSAFMLEGKTTPENFPFVIVVAVAKPGNERAIELAREFHTKMTGAAKWTRDARHPERETAVLPKRRRRS